MSEKRMTMTPDNIELSMEGLKTETRRIIKPNKANSAYFDKITGWSMVCCEYYPIVESAILSGAIKPHYQVGDECWLPEPWWAVEVEGRCIGEQFVVFDDEFRHVPEGGRAPFPKALRPTPKIYRWGRHSSRYLLKKYARKWVKITRVIAPHRIQDINENDALSEGYMNKDALHKTYDPVSKTATLWFRKVWNSIHGPDAWEENKWVFGYEYEKIEK